MSMQMAINRDKANSDSNAWEYAPVEVMMVTKLNADAVTNSKAVFVLEAVVLICCCLYLIPPAKKAQPITSNIFDNTDPNNDN